MLLTNGGYIEKAIAEAEPNRPVRQVQWVLEEVCTKERK
jgi:hypothetical protein